MAGRAAARAGRKRGLVFGRTVATQILDCYCMKTLLRFLVRVLFGFRAYNEGALKMSGPVLLIPNHQSLIDWLFLGVCLDEDWKFVVSSVAAQTSWLHRKISINRRTFLIDNTSPYAVKRMAEYLQAGGRLVLFAEGRLSRTGGLMKLFDGTGFLLHKTQARVITCYLRGSARQRLTVHGNFKQWFPPVSAHFSEALSPPRLEHVSTAQLIEDGTRFPLVGLIARAKR